MTNGFGTRQSIDSKWKVYEERNQIRKWEKVTKSQRDLLQIGCHEVQCKLFIDLLDKLIGRWRICNFPFSFSLSIFLHEESFMSSIRYRYLRNGNQDKYQSIQIYFAIFIIQIYSSGKSTAINYSTIHKKQTKFIIQLRLKNVQCLNLQM